MNPVLRQRRPRTVSRMIWFRCTRCNHLTYAEGIRTECFGCAMAAEAVWPGLGPIQGQASGC